MTQKVPPTARPTGEELAASPRGSRDDAPAGVGIVTEEPLIGCTTAAFRPAKVSSPWLVFLALGGQRARTGSTMGCRAFHMTTRRTNRRST